MTDAEKPWVGDLVRDEGAGRTGIVSDVRGGIYVLRPTNGPGHWLCEVPGRTVLVAREERRDG
ncbi:hypothetical protein SAMN05428945_4090 [Streptomyces sp. 2224.1]|uniref:hypothetical protein n=1 Tax=unclassified Streptomyces TaxID=2593676 RepID=UPI00088DA98C|nr:MULTISPECIES: hypothetical protein [unclassified Streptomyces]PBC81373.1 hypothetical protein BX261_1247 [Streptomyces sp. 2321.6]SDR55330.1 hypothetical protein SAMN05216511_5969 [Streptomyces sp. KS_16]SEC12501.1 hypothetical protein SAMN05428940_1246 [Streptomyces sp. 2133.1]SED18085.1 hypothetical protein SAMN05428945_4090 [Streptomyces sp. 2224.1]SNC65085.1 hypothetical protein SAMN06272741_1245 [Streptomyces sp. 2114.4]